MKTKFLFLFLFITTFSFAQQEQLTRILFVFDASNSMNAYWQSNKKIDVAQKLLAETVDELKGKENLELALRVYGHQASITNGVQDCDDTRLEVPFRYKNHNQITNKIKSVVPKGTTPIARSLEKAANDFPDCPNCRNIIILITDGIEACDEDPCAVSMALRKKGIILKPFVIGIGLDLELKKEFECVGNFFDASSEETFEKVMDIVISQALNNTSAQVNLLNINDKPIETNLPVSLLNAETGAIQYNFVHTLNHKGNPDTLTIDPLLKYDGIAYSIPPQEVENIEIIPGEHTILPISTPQGDLELTQETINKFEKVKCIVREKDQMQTLNVQDFNSFERYVVGLYDLEVLTLPRMHINDVSITQSHTTTISIPPAGVLSLTLQSPGYGGIFEKKGNKLEWVCNLRNNETRSQFRLQPGKYVMLYRSKNSKETIYSVEKEFIITSDQITAIKL